MPTETPQALIENLDVPQVANRAVIPLAVEAGIADVIRSLVGLAVDKRTLLIGLKRQLARTNPPLARALNTQTLDAVLDYLRRTGRSAFVDAAYLPPLLDADGPAVVSAGRDASDPAQINIGFSAPPADHTAELYLDGVYIQDSTQPPTDGTVYDILTGVAPGDHTVRVLFRTPTGGLTRFGPVANIN